MVTHWINKASQKDVEELELNFNHDLEPFRVTSDLIFQIKTLEALHVVDIDFLVTGLRFLKICSMKKVSIKVAMLNVLLKSCTKLKTLEMIKCYTLLHIRFPAKSLNKFKRFRLVSCIVVTEVTLNAPFLITMHYSGQLIVFNIKNWEFHRFLARC